MKAKACALVVFALSLLLSTPAWTAQTDLAWSTFLSGGAYDQGHGIAVDSSGNVHIVGHTRSVDFPTTAGALDSTHNGSQDVFVVELNPTGKALLCATLLGGVGDEYCYDIALDDAANVYITGCTASADFPATAGAIDTTHNGAEDVFVAKLNATGSALEYATFLGGSASDKAYGIALDGSGRIHIIGYTASTDFPTSRAFDSTHNGNQDVFVASLNASGNDLLHATFLGGGDDDYGRDIAVGPSGNVHLTGYTRSADFPTTPEALDTTHNGAEDVFVATLDGKGSHLLYATLLGGSSYEKALGIALDGSGNAHITGYTKSADFPTTTGAFDSTYNGSWDVFATKLNPKTHQIHYSTFLGGSSYEKGFCIALDDAGNVHIAGYTLSVDFPTTTGAFDGTHNNGEDVYVATLNPRGTDLLYATFLGGGVYDASHGIAVDGSGGVYITGNTWSSDFPITPGAYQTRHSRNNSDAYVAKLSLGDILRLPPQAPSTGSP